MISGNAMVGLAQIGRLKETLRRLSDLPRAVAVEAKPGIDKLLRVQFLKGLDPYGEPWAPLATSTLARGRRPPPLTDTKKMRDGTTVTIRSGGRAGLTIKLGAPYGYFAQVGFRAGKTKVAPRRILPQHGLPVAWRIVLRESAVRVARKAVGR